MSEWGLCTNESIILFPVLLATRKWFGFPLSFSTRLGRSPSGVAGLTELLRADLLMSCTCKFVCGNTSSELGMAHPWDTMALPSLKADHSQVPFWYHFEFTVFDRNYIMVQNCIFLQNSSVPTWSFLQPYEKNWTALQSWSWCCLGYSGTEPWISGLLSGSLLPLLL